MPTTIITDSGCDTLSQDAGFRVVPVSIHFGNETFKDGSLDRKSFFERLKSEQPTTQPPSVDEYTGAFTDAAVRGDEIVVVTLSRNLSKSYDHATQAAGRFSNVKVFDSRAASGIETLLALYAVELAKAGTAAAEIVAKLEHARNKAAGFFAVADIAALGRSGRLPKALVALGGVFGVTLVLKMNEGGEIGLASQSRSFDKACEIIVDAAVRAIDRAPTARFAVSHIDAPETATRLQRMVRERLGHTPPVELLSEAPLTIAANLGPGSVGVFAIVP